MPGSMIPALTYLRRPELGGTRTVFDQLCGDVLLKGIASRDHRDYSVAHSQKISIIPLSVRHLREIDP